MIRVVADANVLVSAAIGRSAEAPSARLFDAALDERVELVTSPMLLAEIASVLRRPRVRRFLSLDESERFVADLAAVTALTGDAPLPHAAVCRDPRDDYLLALASPLGPTRSSAATATCSSSSTHRSPCSRRGRWSSA